MRNKTFRIRLQAGLFAAVFLLSSVILPASAAQPLEGTQESTEETSTLEDEAERTGESSMEEFSTEDPASEEDTAQEETSGEESTEPESTEASSAEEESMEPVSNEETSEDIAAEGTSEDTPAELAAAEDLVVTGGIKGTDYTYENNILTILNGTHLTVSGVTDKDHIVVKSGVTAELTIRDLSITGNGNRPLDLKGAALRLHLEGVNTFVTSAYRAAVFCPKDSNLVIEGTGTLNATVDVGGNAAAIGGESTASPSVFDPDWRIFDTDDGMCGSITINSGTVNAKCELVKTHSFDMGVGIGGYGGGPIVINGGTVTAEGRMTSTGIGSLNKDFEGIFINGGTVTAKTYDGGPMDDMGTSGSLGPAIGTVGGSKDEVPIVISGGEVNASSNFGCAGIGGGRNGSAGDIYLTGNAKVTARGGYGAAGIGCGYAQNGTDSLGSRITIDQNAVVNAWGGTNGPGIGGSAPRNVKAGPDGSVGTIIVAGDAKVWANGGANAPGIGTGATLTAADYAETCKVEKIVLTGRAEVHAKGGAGSPNDIGPGSLGQGNPPPEERFYESIITIPLDSGTTTEAQNSLYIDADGNYVVKGEVTLTHDLSIPPGKKLILPQGSILNVPQDITLECPEESIEGNGDIINAGGPEVTYYSVVFESNGGSRVDGYAKVKQGNKIAEPPVPVKKLSQFEGWYKEAELITPWDFRTDTVQGDTVLYAKWSEQGVIIEEIGPQTYTGKAVKPQPTVVFNGQVLTAGKDYSVKYANNTKAAGTDANKPPTVTVTGKGSFKESRKLYFVIEPKNIEEDEVNITYKEFIQYNKKQQSPLPVLKYNGKQLAKNRDFKISYYTAQDQSFSNPLTSITEPGAYVMHIEGIGNYTGEKKLAFQITQNILVSKLKVSLNKKTVPYTGKAVTLQNTEGMNLIVKDGGTILKSSEDELSGDEKAAYRIAYKNNTEVGKATIIITGIEENGYSGSREISFNIQGASITKASVAKLQNLPYTGEEQKQEPVLTVKKGKETAVLKKGTDYTLEYTPAVNAGKVTVLIKGINQYTGSMKKTYQILPVSLVVNGEPNPCVTLSEIAAAVQSKKGAAADIKLYFQNDNGKRFLLQEGTDFTLTYKNNKAVTTENKKAAVSIKGKGNFKGTLNGVKFEILPRDLSAAAVSVDVADMVFNQNKKDNFAYKPKVTVTDGGVKIPASEYEIDYGKNTQSEIESMFEKDGDQITAGARLTITVKAKAPNAKTAANYTGSKTAEFYITPFSISKAVMQMQPRTYTGTDIKDISQEDFKKCEYKVNGKEIRPLTLGTDFTIDPDSYKNNRFFGTAKLTVRGTGKLYGGTKTISFKIEKFSLKELVSRLLGSE